ncbi:hypothetical protein BDV98DRAFT_513296, partial [Pterulicium gracile]
LLIATWVNTLLYTLEIISSHTTYTQVRVYFKYHVQEDPLLVQTMVKVCLLCDSACLIAEYACVYLYAVTHWGEGVRSSTRKLTVYVMTTAVSALVVQMFLIRRYFHLYAGPWKPICLAILSLAALGSAYGSAVVIITHSTYAERGRMTVPVTLWLGVSAVTDWSIALLLIHKLRQMRSDFKSSVG